MTCTYTYTYTGGEQAFTVPDGVTSVDVTAIGGAGGDGTGGSGDSCTLPGSLYNLFGSMDSLFAR